MGNRLYVGNLPYTIGEQQLRDAFSPHGEVTSASVVLDRMTGRSRGFGFVEMATPEAAQKATEAMNGALLDGRPLTVNEARDRAPGGGGGGPGGPRGPRNFDRPRGPGGFGGGGGGDRGGFGGDRGGFGGDRGGFGGGAPAGDFGGGDRHQRRERDRSDRDDRGGRGGGGGGGGGRGRDRDRW